MHPKSSTIANITFGLAFGLVSPPPDLWSSPFGFGVEVETANVTVLSEKHAMIHIIV